MLRCFCCKLWTYFTPFSIVSVANLEQVNVSCVLRFCLKLENTSTKALKKKEKRKKDKNKIQINWTKASHNPYYDKLLSSSSSYIFMFTSRVGIWKHFVCIWSMEAKIYVDCLNYLVIKVSFYMSISIIRQL